MRWLGSLLVVGSGIAISLVFLKVEAAGIAAWPLNLINPLYHLRVLAKCVTMPVIWIGGLAFIAGLWILQSSSESQ